MEMIDDWQGLEPLPAKPADFREHLEALSPPALSVHFYEDVRYPWVQVVFGTIIEPGVALRAGDALAAVVGADQVYFNSLRPQAVYFLLKQPFEQQGKPKPDLPASRYGALLGKLRDVWLLTDGGDKPAGRVAGSAKTAKTRKPRTPA